MDRPTDEGDQDQLSREAARAARMAIATTIQDQLGGRAFAAMTGARNFAALDRGLAFSLPSDSHFAKDGINHVVVRLNDMDTYDMEFERRRGLERTVVSKREDVYCDVLAETFREVTGLETRPIRFARSSDRGLTP